MDQSAQNQSVSSTDTNSNLSGLNLQDGVAHLQTVVTPHDNKPKGPNKYLIGSGIFLILLALAAATYLVRKPSSLKTEALVGSCNVSFNESTHPVCWPDARVVDITYTVHSLPSSGGPFYMQTDWYVAAPYVGPNHYDESQQIQAGQSYTFQAQWPGISGNGTVEIHAGLNVVDKNHNLLNPNCTGGMDYYWTPYVNCTNTPTPSITPRVSVSPTPTTRISVTPTPTTRISVTPTPTTHISVTPTPTTHISVTPTSTTSPSPTKPGDVGGELTSAGISLPTLAPLIMGMILIAGSLLLVL